MKILNIVTVTAALLFAGAAVAGPQCTEASQTEWMPTETMKQRLIDQGYTIDRFKVTDGNCYEIYGEDKNGVKVEIYFNPVSGDPVKERRND
ncbi:putative signal peptide protein [gamma proteobacterium IMCC2047]|nr:putative signal peptide protein [gamma proteobacterium IMCC2047]